MLIDDVKVKVKAGNGGKGAVAFNKNLMSLGPAGGSGGRGGSIYFEGVSDLNALGQFRYAKDVVTEHGGTGMPQFRDGSNGDDLILKVPIGTVIREIGTDRAQEVLKIGQKILVAKGGIGGKGNFHFRSARNTTPTQYQEGRPGEHFTLRLELKFIADVGLIGLPNAGKSSLLNELTRAKSKVANYPFTTLEPNLGAYWELILADVPGLIEGASDGKGLGTKFLRHIERTKVLFHLLSAESSNVVRDYKTIKKELAAHNKMLAKKTEFLFLSKSDTIGAAEMKKKIALLKKIQKNVLPLSIYDWDSVEKVKKILNKIKSEK
ncbi:MAG: GTPase ObgE [bacterium]|nr:GTPase ObgE [bacterium]